MATFQSTLPARGATPSIRWRSCAGRFQSTLPARGATWYLKLTDGREAISIHAPCTGSDDGRRRTSAAAKDFNPRSLHGERPGRFVAAIYEFVISIHAPCTGSDSYTAEGVIDSSISIHAPCTGSDQNLDWAYKSIKISIHAPCTGSDIYILWHGVFSNYFNPRSLHGERRRYG